MTSSVQDVYLSTKTNTALSRFQRRKNMRVFFANGIYFKVASQVNVKTQIELEIWANCSGHRRKKNFSCTLFMRFR